jgi:hypothetical protein
MAARHDGWTLDRRTAFLETLSKTANVTAAAATVGKSTSGAYQLRQRDRKFAADWDRAIESAMDQLVAVALERALNGTMKEVVRGSGETVSIREYSDRLLMFMLSQRRPQAYSRLAGPQGDIASERAVAGEMLRRARAIAGTQASIDQE